MLVQHNMLHLETYKEPWKILVRIVTANSMFYWFHPQTSLVMSLHLTLIKSKHQPLSRYWDHHQPLNYWPSSLHYCPKSSLGPDCNMWSIHPPAKTFQWISYRKQHKKKPLSCFYMICPLSTTPTSFTSSLSFFS